MGIRDDKFISPTKEDIAYYQKLREKYHPKPVIYNNNNRNSKTQYKKYPYR